MEREEIYVGIIIDKISKREILGKFTAKLIAYARKLEEYGFDGMGEDEIKYCIQEFSKEQGL